MYPGSIAQQAPDKPAVIAYESGRVLTYRQLDDESAAIASALYARGLRRGDVVALLSTNAIECFTIYWAALRSGLYITPINRHLTATEVAYIAEDSDAQAIFVSATLADIADALADTTPGIKHRIAFGGEIDGHESYADVVANAGPRLTDQPRGSDMLYSSGTTGRPKGIRPTLPTIQVDEPGDPITAMMSQMFKVGPDDVYLQPAPVYHAAPLKWASAVHALGGTVVQLDKFDPENALKAIEEYDVTIAQFVPTMFVRILQLDEKARTSYDTSSLRMAVHAAAPCPPEVKRAMIEWWGPILFEYYGSSEQHGMYFISTPEWLSKPGSVGKVGMGTAHICDEDGNELPVGEVGAVYFERDFHPFDYHKDPDKTKAATHPTHATWTTVGDLGRVDEDGYLFLADRQAFLIISGGVNIYPQEVENVLTMHEKIFDVAVIGVPHAEMGQAVKAVVQLKGGVEASDEVAQEIMDYARERVAHFKAPRSVDFIDEMPRTPTGKLLKRKLSERYEVSA
ncbi:acyl-CoA synthetase [Nocardioides marmoriginsengisoli]|uniref:Acyl-CoA synthetase n=1 Tax=Nocardioides marmoriginsengisoli TaxID=661483 RepID=A0A3N0CH39_9ACTN|nr:acyl-CoA synthetase [Nocardioides marmoriginsengisoli]RNL62760.1 acyl-CoA synthetase [Nocardioides marmoriginsengisoli]